MARVPKGRLVKGPYKPICRDCAIYFSITVIIWLLKFQGDFTDRTLSGEPLPSKVPAWPRAVSDSTFTDTLRQTTRTGIATDLCVQDIFIYACILYIYIYIPNDVVVLPKCF